MPSSAKYLFFIIFLSIILHFSVQTQPVTITGTALGAENKRIEVIRFSNLITFSEKSVASAVVDPAGRFDLSFNTDETVYAILSVDFHQGDLFVQPAKSYNMSIAPMNYNDMKEVNPFIQSARLEIRLDTDDPAELNSQIRSFDKMYDDFIMENFNALYRDRDRAKVDTFKVHVAERFKDNKDPYFVSYWRYKIGSLVQLSQAMSQPLTGKAYFSDDPILYENTEYMDFFNQFFSKYMTATCRSLKFIDYQAILNAADSYRKMMKALEADTILKRPQLRELVMLKGLMEMYYTAGYNQERILDLLRDVAVQSKSDQNKKIAGEMISALTKLHPGTPAPGFTLKDRMQKDVTLSDFNGKPVVMNFWTTYCQSCISEMDKLRLIYDKYSDRVSFISISADKDFKKMLFFINMKNNFAWNFLHIGEDYDLLKEYDVRSFPLFVLIDKDGNIVQCPADLPGSGLETALRKLIN